MGDVRRADLVMEEVNGSPGVHLVVGTVDGVERAADEVVVGVGEVGHVDVRVLEPRVEDQPGVDDNQRTSIKRHHLRHTITRRPSNSARSHERHADVRLVHLLLPVPREQLLLGLLRLAHWIGIVVVRHAPVRSSRGAPQEVGRPPDDQVEERLESSPDLDPVLLPELVHDGLSQFDGFVHLLVCGDVLALGDVRLPQLHVVGIPMVHRVTALPRVVGDEEERVEDVSDAILQVPVLAEGAVAALVREDPESHGHRAGNRRVGQPEWQGQNVGGIQVGEGGEAERRAESGADHGDGEVAEALGRLGLEAVLGYDLPHGARIGKVVGG
mmetsp:Transcript_39257/g.83831  ORF Transcript_39257/g.83831 Transcript_39257/m.83831 type:complete len:327 (-) Transcript_39257:532-1512(-)